MRLIDADALKKRLKEHYDLLVSAYKNVQDMSLADKSRVDEMLNSLAEVTNAPKIKVEIVVFEKESRKVLADIKQGDVSITRSDVDFRIFTDTEPIFTDKNGSVYFDDKWIMQMGESE